MDGGSYTHLMSKGFILGNFVECEPVLLVKTQEINFILAQLVSVIH